MKTATLTLTNTQAAERARHAARLLRLANALSHHLAEYNAMMTTLKPFAKRIGYALTDMNNAISEANAFMESIDCDGPKFPPIEITVPTAIEYDSEALDYARNQLDELPRER